MLAILTFQHRHWQIVNRSPACWQFTSIMTVSDVLIGISTSTVPAFPVNFSCLPVCLSWLAFLPPQFGSDLGFQTVCGYDANPFSCRSLHLALDFLQDRFPFLIL